MEKKTLMHSSVIAAIIIAAIAGVSLVTGFPGTSPSDSGGPVSDTTTAGKPAITGDSTAGTADFIKVDPIADKTTGDLLIVTGSTNLPAGTNLMVQAGNYGGSTEVHKGAGGVNRFSAPVDTFSLKPGSLTITVTRMEGSVTTGDYRLGTLSGKATFTLKGAYLAADTPVQPVITGEDYIRLDPISDHKAGDQFLVTGMTSLPVGTSIFWQIIQDKGTIADSIDMTGTGIMANNGVTKAEGTTNRVSLAVDLETMPPGKYIAVVSEMKGDVEKRDIRMGDLVGSARFTIT